MAFKKKTILFVLVPLSLPRTAHNEGLRLIHRRCEVGVGIMITHDPLHRAGRAELPHPAPTLGEHAQAHERIRMTNLSRRKPFRNVAPHATPRQMMTLATTAQYRPPQITHCLAKSGQRPPRSHRQRRRHRAGNRC